MRATRLWRQQQKQLLQACAALNGACPVASVPIATSAWQQAAHTQACIRIQSSLSGVPSRCEHAMEHAHDTCIRRFATSAEFSGGVFTENSEKSSTQHLDDQEPDDKLMLLEAALGFVVSLCRL